MSVRKGTTIWVPCQMTEKEQTQAGTFVARLLQKKLPRDGDAYWGPTILDNTEDPWGRDENGYLNRP